MADLGVKPRRHKGPQSQQSCTESQRRPGTFYESRRSETPAPWLLRPKHANSVLCYLVSSLHSPLRMCKQLLLLVLLTAGATSLPASADAESTVAHTDLSLRMETDTNMPLPGSNIAVTVTIDNDGDFSADDAVVSIPVPTGLSLIGATTIGGSYDESAGEWTTGEVQPFVSKSLRLDMIVDVDGPATISIVADLSSVTSSFGSFDPDSSPGNSDPCEDDYASLVLQPAGVPFLDAGSGAPDAGACPGPVSPVDGGPGGSAADAGDLDAGTQVPDDSGSGCGCAVAGSTASSWQLLLLGLFLLLGRPKRRQC